MDSKKYVILDIDQTLLKSEHRFQTEIKTNILPNEFIMTSISYDDVFIVRKRKNLDEFISNLEKNYNIVVWSAGEETYVKQLVNIIFKNRKIAYVFTSNHLNESKSKNSKDLNVLKKYIPNFEVKNSVLIDDLSENAVDNPNNYIEIKQMDNEDDELLNTFEKIEQFFKC